MEDKLQASDPASKKYINRLYIKTILSYIDAYCNDIF